MSSVRAYCRQKWGPDWWKTDKKSRKSTARAALVPTPALVHTDADVKVGRALVEYTESTKYPVIVECSKCRCETKGCHVYIAGPRPYYLVGCSHVAYDGDSWCDSCITLTRDKNGDPAPMCMKCAGVDWGAITDKSVCFYDPRQ
jgi:hypothetical protein